MFVSPKVGSFKVLVVDDSGVIRSIIVRALRAMGVRKIVEAADGEEAWSLFQENEYGLVITDWHMPIMSGLDLTVRIRTQDLEIPIVMVTIVDTKERIVKALEAGVSDYLCKPFQRADLQAKLDKYVPLIL
jgi:two-component system, chemotaxis family, chemotaxis protein CheY